ncbi:MAG: DNA repair protein RecO [Candidatus Aminicenantes bacterium]|nr:DNA repair protein RecO [Candidatus Aminicenantes bacterium]
MPKDQTEAIVLRSFHVGDQDKIVVFFSRNRGILKGIAKGARKFGNRFGSCLEPLSHIKVYFYEKESKDLVTVSQSDLLESFFEIQSDLDTAFTLRYFSELIEHSLPSRSEDDVLYRLLLQVLRALKKGKELILLTAYFELWFLKINGFFPNLKKCKRCGQKIDAGFLSSQRDGILCSVCSSQHNENINSDDNSLFAWIIKNPPTSEEERPFSKEQIRRARQVLKKMIVYHMESRPRFPDDLKKHFNI